MPSPRKPRLGASSVESIFLDIVAYSERTIEAQAAVINVLNTMVRRSVESLCLGSENVIYIPTGDGICIALLDVSDPPDVQIKLALAF
jgi:hypothetical protein